MACACDHATTAQVFLSASQDGTVRQFDLRAPHPGTCEQAHAHAMDYDPVCRNVVVDLRHAAAGGGRVAINSLALSPVDSSALLLLACAAGEARLRHPADC